METTNGQVPEEKSDKRSGTNPTEAEPKSYDEDFVHGLNRENAKWRTQVRDLEKQVETLTKVQTDAENSKKTEVERLTEEKARLERELTDRDQAHQTLAIKTEVKLAAQKEGIIDPDAAYALIDLNLIEYDDGKVSGIDKALKALLKDKPYLSGGEKPEPPTPGIGGEAIGATGKPSLEGEMLRVLKGQVK